MKLVEVSNNARYNFWILPWKLTEYYNSYLMIAFAIEKLFVYRLWELTIPLMRRWTLWLLLEKLWAKYAMLVWLITLLQYSKTVFSSIDHSEMQGHAWVYRQPTSCSIHERGSETCRKRWGFTSSYYFLINKNLFGRWCNTRGRWSCNETRSWLSYGTLRVGWLRGTWHQQIYHGWWVPIYSFTKVQK